MNDESWAMDNLRVSVTTLQPTATVPEPASLTLLGTGVLAPRESAAPASRVIVPDPVG